MKRVAVDTNVLVYAFTTTDSRSTTARAILAQGCDTTVQSLNEFVNVARRKLGMSWPEVRESLLALRALCRHIVPLDLETHEEALRVAERYGLAFFDALIVAAVRRAGYDLLYSEDLQDRLVVDGSLQIVNPFRAAHRAEGSSP